MVYHERNLRNIYDYGKHKPNFLSQIFVELKILFIAQRIVGVLKNRCGSVLTLDIHT